MSYRTLPKSFAAERSGTSTSSGGRSLTRKPRPILRDLRNTLTLQAIESGRYTIEQGASSGASPFLVIESPSSPEPRRHHHGDGTCLLSPIALPITPCSKLVPRTTPSFNMLGSAPVDILTFRVSKHDTSPEEENIFNIKRSSSMIISYPDHGDYDIDNTSSPLSLRPGSKHAAIYQYPQTLKPQSVPLNRRIVDRNALVFTVPPRSPTPSLSPPTAPSSPISDLVSKRSARMFRLVPAQNDRFMHAVATDLTGYRIESPLDSPGSSSTTQIGFPPDMLALLQELDELASWVQGFPHPEEASGALDVLTVGSTVPVSCPHALQRLGNELGDHFLSQSVSSDKGKRRKLTESTDDMSEWKCQFPTSRSAIPPASTPVARRRSARYIYDPRVPIFLSFHIFLIDKCRALHHSSLAVPPHRWHIPQRGTGAPLASSSHLVRLLSPVSLQVPLSSEHSAGVLFQTCRRRPWSLRLQA
ncbi:uncharacterized protein EDB91DRAFT_1117841 [Suillus paluster]|uniref:uncharacterized protein n=1 Tax=Suillus paluster TaxID=48578 RepID=UPI001B86E1F2|nr:uncharacterized protein EDB91DRAFT_1117841 [Suillus paluster]KAG1746596.1 hypothetical protein EDB91DRAFT_1117841 [Suillus paluster]